MATKSISQLDTAVAVSNDDLFETAVPDSGSATGYSSKKHSMAVIADHAANTVVYPTLQTTAKTLVGAINEAAQGGGGGGGINYSETEQDTGLKWIDGSAIYQKTINTGVLPNNASNDIAHGVSNMGIVLQLFGFAVRPSDNTLLTLPHVNNANLNNQIQVMVVGAYIRVTTKIDRTNFTTSYVTIQYTKTQSQ